MEKMDCRTSKSEGIWPVSAKASTDWQVAALAQMSPTLKSNAMASLCIAVFDGLMLERMRGGDIRRLTESLDLFIAMAAKASPAGKSSRLDRKRGRTGP